MALSLARSTPAAAARTRHNVSVSARASSAPKASSWAPRDAAKKIARVATATSLSLLLAGGGMFGPALSPALARTPDDALGLAAEEIEALEPVIAEDAPIIEKRLGKSDFKEIVQEISSLEHDVERLEAKADDAVGFESSDLDKAAKPLLSRIAQLRSIVGLVDDNAVEAR